MREYVTLYKIHETHDHVKYKLPVEYREEIVRCGDCKYYETVPEDSGDWCGYWTDRIYADARGSGFCAWGVKEES